MKERNMMIPTSISYSPKGSAVTTETLEEEYEHHCSPRQSRRSKTRHSNATAATAGSSSSQKNDTNKTNQDKTNGYLDEKAAIRNSILVQGAGFRREKQDIVAAMGHSPALLLSPSADIRLQRKLDSFNYNNDCSNGSRRSISSNPTSGSQRLGGIAVDGYSPGGSTSDPLGPIPQQQSRNSRWSNAIEPVLDHDEEMPHNLSNDGIDEYAITQAEIKRKKFRCYVIVAIVASLLLGAVIGVVVALTQSGTVGNSSGDECTGNIPANTGCIVPECARIKYQELKAMYPSLPDYDVTRSLADNEDCAADHIAANALAIRWTTTNNIDEMKDSDAYFALATMYFSLRGEKWNRAQNWLQPSPVCEWHGVNCTKDQDGKKDVIIALSLPDNHMVGMSRHSWDF
ncbi:hypothetical protein MHU86_4671 [Fragilaria crotonensis]|nr:hypothetical protein MHU86_4671 [Fragilaria crotonensis]